MLRSVWDEPRPPGPGAVPAWRNHALLVVLAAAPVLEGLLRPDLPWRGFTVTVAVALVPVVLLRHTRPLLAVAIAFSTCALASLVIGADLGLTSLVYLLMLPYSLARWGAAREVAAGFAIMIGKLGMSTVLGYLSLADASLGLAVLFAAVAVGAAVRYRAGARMRELAQVKLLERERLARDLHDTVAHHVSAIAIRAQAGLAVSAGDPDAASEALRVIEAEASRALGEMRTMVRALRRDEAGGVETSVDLAPVPGVRDLEQLASRGRDGPVVDVELRGDVDDLPPTVGSAIYRLAQESVTNARRHARHATRIAVSVAADEGSVRLRVSDDGDASAKGAAPGFGLIGMIERAVLLGGTCEAGPNAGRGWTVTAVLPRSGLAAA